MGTTKALAVDTEITRNAEQVHTLRQDQSELRAQLEVADQSVHQIADQQSALQSLLSGLEDNLDLKLPTKDTDGRASRLETQLDELTRQVRELASETAAFQTSKYARPIDRVAHVLDAHSSELDSVQARLD